MALEVVLRGGDERNKGVENLERRDYIVMAYIAMADIVMALYSYAQQRRRKP